MSINDLRRSQIVIPFGPGAIYDYKEFSAITMEVDSWEYANINSDFHQIKNNRFIKFINKKMRFYEGINSKRIYKLLHPPIAYDTNASENVREQMGHVNVKKFPSWGLCSRCNALSKFDPLTTTKLCNSNNVEPRRISQGFQPCSQVRNKGIIEPVRFISYCAKGHIDDLPWIKLMRQNCKSDCDMSEKSHSSNHPLLFLSDNSLGNGFASLIIECGSCLQRTSLAGINKNKEDFLDEFGEKIFKCSGNKPWSTCENEDCNLISDIEPRAASKIYNSVQLSSIYVPEADSIISEFILDPTVQDWIKNDTLISEIELTLKNVPVAFGDKYNLSTQQMLDMIQEERDLIRSEMDDDEEDDDNEFLISEYETLCKKKVDHEKFVSKSIPLDKFGSKIEKKFTNLNQIKKLHSSVALLGFKRIATEYIDDKLSFNASRKNVNFLPGYEIIGEGIFIDFGYEKVLDWLSKNSKFSIKGKQLKKNGSKNSFLSFNESNFNYGYIMMHTFSHMLMNQLSIECGYSITEIKERIYFCEANKMAGVLIYTASSDSAGSLGGLVRMIKPNYFDSLVENAIINARHCSNDPICKESQGQGYSALCMAACHACAMIPDLACCSYPSNSFLDRNALIGDEDQANGYFSDF